MFLLAGVRQVFRPVDVLGERMTRVCAVQPARFLPILPARPRAGGTRAGAVAAWAARRGRTTRMKVEIWSDLLCPFCYIGKRKFERALERFAHREEVEVVWRSFELMPDA